MPELERGTWAHKDHEKRLECTGRCTKEAEGAHMLAVVRGDQAVTSVAEACTRRVHDLGVLG